MTSFSTNNHASIRFSTYSGAPSLHPSIAATTNSTTTMSHIPIDSARNTITSSPKLAYKPSATTYETEKLPISRADSVASSGSDSRTADIKLWAATFDRMQDQRLDKQRFIVSGKKGDEISVNALAAKLERALDRRMSGQDATFSRRAPRTTLSSEKRSVQVAA